MRTWSRIGGRARELQVLRIVERFGRKKVNEYHFTVSYADLEAAMQYAEKGEDEAYMCRILDELAENTVKGEILVIVGVSPRQPYDNEREH